MLPVISVLRTHPETKTGEILGGALAGAGATWTMLTVHAAVRLGIRSPLARTATALTASVWLYLGLLRHPLPWAGPVFLQVLDYALFAENGHLRLPALSLLLILPIQLVVLVTTWLGFDR